MVEGVESAPERVGPRVKRRAAPSIDGRIRRRILAVDGGQSTTRVAYSQIEERVDAPGVSRAPGSEERLVTIVRGAWESLGRPMIDRAVLGLTTAPSDPAGAQALATTIGSAILAQEVWVCDDAVTSHAGGLSLGWGFSLTAGTGVASLAVPDRGAPRIIGGFGYLLGDEGGAFSIGREGLRAVLRGAEGRGPTTALADLAVRRYGPLDGLPVRLHDSAAGVDAIAGFAMDVFDVADRDGVAATIVREAAAELHAVIRAGAVVAGGPDAIEPVPVALGGRLLDRPTPLRVELDGRLVLDETLRYRTADHSPLDGALLLGGQPTPGRYEALVHVWRGSEA